MQAADVIDGLTFMHSLDIVHGDMKPVRRSIHKHSLLLTQYIGQRVGRLRLTGTFDGLRPSDHPERHEDCYRAQGHVAVHGPGAARSRARER